MHRYPATQHEDRLCKYLANWAEDCVHSDVGVWAPHDGGHRKYKVLGLCGRGWLRWLRGARGWAALRQLVRSVEGG